MKTKIFRFGEKGFEEEKVKLAEHYKEMTRPRNKAKKRLSKEEQLRLVFKKIVEYWGLRGSDIDNVTYLLLREVKIRVNLK